MPDRVLIVGAGPTGLTASLELSRLGIPVRIIDEESAPETKSRAVGVQARTLGLLPLRGLADEMVRLGNPGLAASFYGGGERVFRLDFTRIDSRYHYLLFISPAETERILRTAVENQGVRIERGVELVGLAQDVLSPEPSPVRVMLRHADGRLIARAASTCLRLKSESGTDSSIKVRKEHQHALPAP
jgi:2-polyprenyl-6-methoxyphenol hydroxylase-like FAD-dependent oxidoreductase